MRITPLDVRKQEFRKVVRGLEPEEVYAFLATIADEYETVLTDNKQLRDRVLELDEKVSEYRNMEKTLRDTLLTAERVMAEARENARKEAELIVRDANVKAQQEAAAYSAQADRMRHQLRELRTQRDSFLARLKGLAESQVGLVDSFARDFREDDDRSTRESRGLTSPASGDAPSTGSPSIQRDENSPTTRDAGGDQWRNYKPGVAGAVSQAPAAPERVTAPEPVADDAARTGGEPEASAASWYPTSDDGAHSPGATQMELQSADAPRSATIPSLPAAAIPTPESSPEPISEPLSAPALEIAVDLPASLVDAPDPAPAVPVVTGVDGHPEPGFEPRIPADPGADEPLNLGSIEQQLVETLESVAVDAERLDAAGEPLDVAPAEAMGRAEAADSGQPRPDVAISADLGGETGEDTGEGAEPAMASEAAGASGPPDNGSEGNKGSRWSISRFTRGLGDF